MRRSRTLAGIYDVMNGAAMMGVASAERKTAFPRRDRRRKRWPPAARQRRCRSPCSARSDTIDRTDIVIVPSVLLKESGWEKGRYPRLVNWLRAHARGRCNPLLRLFRPVPAGRDGTFRRQGFNGVFRLCPHLRRPLPGRGDSSGTGAGDLRPARGTGQLRCLDVLARSGALPHRAPRRCHHGPGGGAPVRTAMAPGWPCALHRLRRPQRPRRRRNPGRADLARAATSRSPTRWRK